MGANMKKFYLVFSIFLSITSINYASDLFLERIRNELEGLQKCIQTIVQNEKSLYKTNNNYIETVIKKNEICSNIENILINDFLKVYLKEDDMFLKIKLSLMYLIINNLEKLKEKTEIQSYQNVQDNFIELEKIIKNPSSNKKGYLDNSSRLKRKYNS